MRKNIFIQNATPGMLIYDYNEVQGKAGFKKVVEIKTTKKHYQGKRPCEIGYRLNFEDGTYLSGSEFKIVTQKINRPKLNPKIYLRGF